MQKEAAQNQGRQILDHAIAALAETANVHVKATKTKDPKADYDLKIDLPDQKVVLLVEVKRTMTEAVLGQLVVRKLETAKKWVLIAEHIKAPQAEILKNLDIAFFDTVGNAYFNLPGLHIYVNTKKPKVEKPTRRKVPTLSDRNSERFRPSDLKILFALLSLPGLEREEYRTIAGKTDSALGSIAWLMSRLRDGGFLGPKTEHVRKLRNKKELFAQWVDGYISSLRPKLLISRFESELRDRWWDRVDLRDYKACWSGEIAAERLTRYLRPASVTMYADDSLPRLQSRYRLRRSARGDVEIVRKFWTDENGEVLAPPLIIYADLMASGDSRNVEAARLIYDQFIHELIGENSR